MEKQFKSLKLACQNTLWFIIERPTTQTPHILTCEVQIHIHAQSPVIAYRFNCKPTAELWLITDQLYCPNHPDKHMLLIPADPLSPLTPPTWIKTSVNKNVCGAAWGGKYDNSQHMEIMHETDSDKHSTEGCCIVCQYSYRALVEMILQYLTFYYEKQSHEFLLRLCKLWHFIIICNVVTLWFGWENAHGENTPHTCK